jgi:membrane protein implicated in regulation of membrane protease activity
VIFILAVVAKILWVDGPWGWVLIGVAAVIEVGESYLWIRWSNRRHPHVGAETLVGREAVVVTPCHPEGQVRVQGEIWSARCDERADPGDRVTVLAVDELTLRVRRA